MKAERGFTLLEMIVATVILAVAIVGLLSGISGAMRNAARLTAYDRVVQLARLRMNDLLVDSRLPRDTVLDGQFDPALTGGVEAGWRARVARFEMPPNPVAGAIALQRIELEIWWMSGSARRTFTLDAFRPQALKPEDLQPVGP
jgi:general secretion pathway protein I